MHDEFCFTIIGRANNEGSKAMSLECLAAASQLYPCSNLSSLKLLEIKGSIGHAYTVCIHTENQTSEFLPYCSTRFLFSLSLPKETRIVV